MKDKKKIIIALTAVIVVIALILVSCAISKNNRKTEKEITPGNTETTISGETESVTEKPSETETIVEDNEDPTPGDLALPGEETTTEKKKKKNKETTNYWDNIEVYEETQADNPETASEEYPGQNEGWSPIVSPDELN